ncbi:MAG: hypothetical protein ACRENP_21580 [Longimicrobiales bacterium]
MAIRDLLYACIHCGREGGIKPTADGEACDRCGTRYFREDGALIRVERADGSREVKHPAQWLDQLEAQRPPQEAAPERKERVAVRIAQGDKPLTHRGTYLGRIEQFGAPQTGCLTLTATELRFVPDRGQTQVWPLIELTAVQPSSSALQLKIRRGPVLSLRFLDASPLLWEERVRNAIQARYALAGLGEILEFQPRIVCR